MESGIKLYPHNQKAYAALRKKLSHESRACVIQPTGTGKFVIIAKMVQDNPEKRFLLLGTNEYMFNDQMRNLAKIAPGFAPENLRFMTYSAAMAASRRGEDVPKFDVIIADEFHHCGAPEWSKGVQWVIDGNSQAKVIGFTATPIRYSDNGRDMADEMFDGNVASSMELEEAWLRGILPIPKYVIALYDAPQELGELQVSIEKVRDKRKYSNFVKKYEQLRRSLQDAGGVDKVIAKHLEKRDAKVIVFCPSETKLRDFMLLRREWFSGVNDEIHVYKTTSADPYGSRDFRKFQEDDSEALKVLYCINQLNEAVHIDGIDAIVMVRPTKSPVIFTQQLGRVLSSGGNRTPLVFDLCNNFGSLGGITGMQGRMEKTYRMLREKKEKTSHTPSDFKVVDEVKAPRDLAMELRSVLNPRVSVDERIALLEQAAEAGEIDTDTRGYTSGRADLKNVKETLRRLWREGRLTKGQEERLARLGFSRAPMKRKAVVCYETGELFDSIADAARAIGVDKSAIPYAIRNRTRSGGYHWYYESEGRPSECSLKMGKPKKPVVCIETGHVFSSTGAAAHQLGLTVGDVSKAARKGYAAKGFHFRYVDDSTVSIKPRAKVEVVCVETGKKYDSVKDAARSCETGPIDKSCISAALRSGGRAGGYHWRYADIKKPRPPLKYKKGNSRTVMCCETGEVFDSIKAAERNVGVSKNSIWRALNCGGTSGGYHWEYVDTFEKDDEEGAGAS